MGVLQIKEGLRMARRAQHVRKHGFKAYRGTPQEICAQIIDEAYDRQHKYFRVSSGNFCEFYVRDFGLCCEALYKLGYEKEVRATLQYAIAKYRKAGRITTAINPEGVPFDYFLPTGPDALGFLLYAITRTGNDDLAQEHRAFLQRMLDNFSREFIDPRTLLPRTDRHYSSIRDQAKRKGACYDAVMIAVTARESARLRLTFRYAEQDITDAIIKEYWNGTYFFQDTVRQAIVVADANVFPFWTGIVTDRKMLEDAMDAIRAAGLDTPFPLRYVSAYDKKKEKTALHAANMLANDYETDSIWTHLGLAYLRVLKERDEDAAKRHLAKYTKLVEEHKNFLEVYDTHGRPFKRFFYSADESIIWCANYLVLAQELE
jgi:hypothetical protein